MFDAIVLFVTIAILVREYPQDHDLSDEGVLKVVRNSLNLFSKES